MRSPQPLTDVVDFEPDTAPTARVDEVLHAATGRQRLTVREMQIALEAARCLAGDGQRAHLAERPAAAFGQGDQTAGGLVNWSGADRGRGAMCHDGLDAVSPVTPRLGAAEGHGTAAHPDTGGEPGPGADERGESWLPAHDGPVSLTGVAAPRTRTVRRTAATPDKAARRPSKQRTPPVSKSSTLDPGLAAAAVAAPPRIVIVAACGGAGATTAAVLLGAALAPVVSTMVVASGADRGALAVRADAHAGDGAQLAAWARHHNQLLPIPNGTATGNAGTGALTLAAAGREEPDGDFDTTTACDLFVAAAAGGLAVLLDWSSSAPPPGHAWTSATHVLVTAPATSPGLLAAEYTVEDLAGMAAATPLSVLTIDVRGRSPRRAGRAALARLRALQLPVTAIPYDPALADELRVHWPALRPRTRTAVVGALSELLRDHHRKGPK